MPRFTEGLEKLPFLDEGDVPVGDVQTSSGPIKFFLFGSTTEFRARTLLTKEPETIAWIDQFAADSVFWDIGANIGCFSLYAAIARRAKVVSFEPSPVNVYLLGKHFELNEIGDYTIFPFGLESSSNLIHWSPNLGAGSADNQLKRAGRFALQSFALNDLLRGGCVEPPNYIKLDVDGLEPEILRGAKDVLSNPSLRSVICEVNESRPGEKEEVCALMQEAGFSAPVTRHPPYWDDYHYAPIFNYIFSR